jgi:hypothetical protein
MEHSLTLYLKACKPASAAPGETEIGCGLPRPRYWRITAGRWMGNEGGEIPEFMTNVAKTRPALSDNLIGTISVMAKLAY